MKAQIVQRKWEDIEKAFDNFDIERVEGYESSDIERLMNNSKIIRHKGKIEAIIFNAQVIRRIQKKYGGLGNFISTFQDPEKLMQNLVRVFKYIGRPVAWDFLGAIGFNAVKLKEK